MAQRQIVLDTETTGLNCSLGDRVIEIGCVEILGRNVTEKHFHVYLNPERDIEEGAAQVHGLTREFLSEKPRFAEIGAAFADYVRGAELIIHNAGFDCEFLDAELGLAGLGKLSTRSFWRAICIPESAIRSMRCANATASRMPIARCMEHCSMRACWPRSTWP